MFRLQNHAPEVYVDKSRDFQLFCRLYDSCFGSVKFSIDSMAYLTDTKNCDSSTLELLKTKLGLFSTIEIDTQELRCLLQAFPTIMRYKGSKRSVDYIRILYTKMYPNVSFPDIEYRTTDHELTVVFKEPPKNDKLLHELFKYVLPTGYIISYAVATTKSYENSISTKDELVYQVMDSKEMDIDKIAEIKPNSKETNVNDFNGLLGAVTGLTEIRHPETIQKETNNE